jgi:integrase
MQPLINKKIMAIVKKGKDKWLVRVFTGRDENGKTKFFNEVIRGKKDDAKAFEVKKKAELKSGVILEHSKTTLNEYLDKWLNVAAKPRLRERTYEDYIQYLNRYIRPKIGKIELSKLKPLDIQAVYTWMLEEGLSPRTVRFAHSILSSALKQAVKWQILPMNPATMVNLPKNQSKEMMTLSPDEARKFLKVAKKDKWHLIFMLAITTGMRPEEYFGLQWKDIHFEKGTATIQRVLVWRRKGGGWTLEDPKTPKSRRTVPLPSSVLSELKKHSKKQQKEKKKLGDGYQDFDFVFATEIGTPLLNSNLMRRHFKPLLKAAELSEKIRLYDLRHTCATLLLSEEENPKVVSERLGHSTVVLTLDTYSHVLPTMQQKATEKLQNLLFE